MDLVDRAMAALRRSVLPSVIARGGTVRVVAVEEGTAILEVRYRNVTPVEQELRFESWIAEDRGRRIVARATCHAGETLTADAKGTFVRVDFDEVRRRMLGEEIA